MEIGRASRLWSLWPRELADEFRPHADAMAKSILQEIQRAVPEYAQPLEGLFGETITLGIEQAVLHCLDNIGDSRAPQDQWAAMFRRLGELEFGEGRSLNCLQTAYRVGGRVAWRYVAEIGQMLNLPTELLCVGAEAIFAYVDEMSAMSIEGYTRAQLKATRTLESHRRRLLEAILASPPASPKVIVSRAAAAGWAVPEQITVVALERLAHRRFEPAAIPADVLCDVEAEEPCLVLPAGSATDLPAVLQGWRAAVGPVVRLSDARTSLRWARRTISLVERGVVPGQPVTQYVDQLRSLWLLADEFLIEQLTDVALAPLRGLTAKQQQRLGETLLAWLETRGGAPDIAEELSVHPQTVRYRMRQLEELFGARLTNADDRLDIQIALRAQRLIAEGATPARSAP
ncbi:PucR family transcriptional regulator [Amycolatopsis nigrescens]|uniref:PucR family transcriptional regulator n=1 Tax=Amycolatopsis nigrescens TaxID=381445 RepID=UPI00035F4B1D|nr:PucR family transcriptional regulator [Amycolatopsis nigrescens]